MAEANEEVHMIPMDGDFNAECTVNNQYMSGIFTELNAQRLSSDHSLCDVVLFAQGHRFPAHKCVLVATSDYFRGMFSDNKFTEGKSKDVKLQSISAKALETILDMVYTFRLKLNLENVHDILAAADHLMLTEAKKFCCSFLTSVIKTDDSRSRSQALRIRKSAEMYRLKELAILAEKVIGTQFETIVKGQDYLQLDIQEVYDLLSSDQLEFTDEYIIWDAAISWLEHDLSTRKQDVDMLMEIIRFPLIDSKLLIKKIKTHPLMTTERCQEFIAEALNYQILPTDRCSHQTSRTKPRCTEDTTLIYCLAGMDQFLVYVPHKDKWFSLQGPAISDCKTLSDVKDAGISSSMESLEEGPTPVKRGRRGKRSSQQTPRPSTSAASQVVSFNVEDLYYGILTVAGKVFMRVHSRSPEECGKYTLRKLLMYSIAENTWRNCRLPQQTNYTLLIECDKIIYSCSRKGIESYDPENDSWTTRLSASLSPCQFGVSDPKRIYLYNLENGGIEIIHTEKNFLVTKNQIMWFGRFDILTLSKLDSHDVFLSLRTSSGISREIINVRTNHWQDVNKRIYPGMSAVQPKPGVSYPHCLHQDDPWEVVHDRRTNHTYVLAKWSSITDCPVFKSKTSQYKMPPRTHNDGVIPFFKIDETKTWQRQSALSEFLLSPGGNGGSNGQILQLCISDSHSSMATKIP